MKRLTITNTHGWTVRALRKKERMVEDGLLRQRITAVRLVMEGYLGKEVAAILNIHRQSVASYIKSFNEGVLPELLTRRVPPGKDPYLSTEQQVELKRIIHRKYTRKRRNGCVHVMG
ncbi:helix-turn-helix domain-containing protein [Bacillus sp. CGMCC 1.60114]|uniref:helix-turn-helix domain-containing protein n=1 Tax=unclassified Bacillus (in: firmicutes) TaxID=185979 RepID=UPI003629A613